MSILTKNGTLNRVYGGDCNLVHIEDGQRREVGHEVSELIDITIRNHAEERGEFGVHSKKLCPGCYMIAGFNALVELAKENGQPITELANTMAEAFRKLAENPEAGVTEEINVILDNDEEEAPAKKPERDLTKLFLVKSSELEALAA